MSITLYHNPRCSKSRSTLKLLREHDVEPEIVEYLKTPPDAATLAGLFEKLGLNARDAMRKNEKAYKDNNLADESLSEDDLIAAIVEHPILLQRPIAVKGNKAIIGRPPEQVLELL